MRLHSTRYLVGLTVMWGALSFFWTALGNNIVPTRVLEFGAEATKGSRLGLVTVLGALVSMLTGPIAGVLSDESRLRWGRRRPFLALGMTLNVFALLALLGATTFAGFVLAFLAVQLCTNIASGPYSALIPDQVHDLQKGKATGLAGFAEVFGRLIGSIAGGLLIAMPAATALIGPILFFMGTKLTASPMLPLGLVLTVVTVGSMAFTLWWVREDLNEEPRDATGGNLIRRAFTFRLEGQTSFAWLLVSRAFNMLGINTIVTFLLYYLRDYLGVNDIAEANAKLGYLFAASSVTTLPSSLYVGYLIDRDQKRKVWVYASSIGLSAVCLAFLSIEHYHQALIVGVFFGFCYGAYFTSDWALALALLPKDGKSAKYMGIWGIAGTLPQVLAPGIGGVLLDAFNAVRPNLGYQAVFLTVVAYFFIGTAILIKVAEPETSPLVVGDGEVGPKPSSAVG